MLKAHLACTVLQTGAVLLSRAVIVEVYANGPAGQAFAKHYNPLLSQETSQEVVDESSQHQRVGATRLDEHAQSNQVHELEASTAATTHAQQTQDTAATAQHQSPVQLPAEEDAKQSVSYILTAQPHEDPAVIDDLHAPPLKTGVQLKLGNQIALALQRHGRGVQSSKQVTPDATSSALPGAATPLSVQPVVELDATNTDAGCLTSSQQATSAMLGSCRQPALPPSKVALPGSLLPYQPEPDIEPDVQCSGPSAAAMFQSMTARAASYGAGIKQTDIPSSPIPSIDRFSSTSSWGASTVPSNARSRAIDSVLTVASHSTDLDTPAALQPCQTSDRIPAVVVSTSKQQSQGGQLAGRRKGKLSSLERKHSTGAIRAMHDSSSSWSSKSNAVSRTGSAIKAQKALPSMLPAAKQSPARHAPALAEQHTAIAMQPPKGQDTPAGVVSVGHWPSLVHARRCSDAVLDTSLLPVFVGIATMIIAQYRTCQPASEAGCCTPITQQK